MGNILQEPGRTDDAIDYYQQILKVTPNSPPVLCNLGNVLRENGLLDEAIALTDITVRAKSCID